VKYVVVDTDVFSLLFRGQDVDLYRPHLDGAVPVLSFVSVAELYYGATYAGWGERRRQALEEAIRRYVIAPYDEEMAKLWGTLKTQALTSPDSGIGHQQACGGPSQPSPVAVALRLNS
jgi:tRNA(fMet)-specific endonuclease VapC